MRLIDADKIDFGKVFMGVSNFAKDTREAAQNLIDSQPAVYDVDKVVERLEERKKYLQNEFLLADKAKEVKEKTFARINEIDGMIDIVRFGDIE